MSPAHGHAGCAAQGRTRNGSRVHSLIAQREEAPDSTPATSLRLPRSTSPQPPLNQTKSLREFPNPPPEDGRHRVRVASGPYPPGSSRCDLEGRKRRFLTYAFPPRSPGPHHLAVLTRPGFVGAACHPNPASPRPGCPQLRSPAATEPRSRSLTSTQSMCTSRRTRLRSQTTKRPHFSSNLGRL